PTPKMGGDEAMLGMPVWFWIVAVVIGVTIVYSGNKNVLSRWRSCVETQQDQDDSDQGGLGFVILFCLAILIALLVFAIKKA
ncbi:MAG: hypothetical protein PHX83_12225, partial [Acidobacteriia bacterium]|nr:hypothetical protein [Terriglobia bacterium]